MRVGMRTTSAPGNIQDIITEVHTSVHMGRQVVTVSFTVPTIYRDRYFYIYLNGDLMQRYWYEASNEGFAVLQFPIGSISNAYSIWIEDGGQWADVDYNPNEGAKEFESYTSNRLGFEWTVNPTFKSKAVSPQFSNIAITGIQRFTTCERDDFVSEQVGKLNITVTDTGGTRTITVYNGSDPIAEGSITGDGTVTLSELNKSNVGGTIDITYVEDATEVIYCFWPQSYQVHYSQTPLTFPRTPEDIVSDEVGVVNYYHVSNQYNLTAGNWYCAVVAISDTGKIDATVLGTKTVELKDLPESPSYLKYYDGDTDAVRISFLTPDSTSIYRIYACDVIGENINTSVVKETKSAAASGTEVIAGPYNFGANETGILRFIVRSVNAIGIEEKNGNVLTIDFENGTRVFPRPNQPKFKRITRNQRTVTIRAIYDIVNSRVIPFYIRLFVVPLGDNFAYSSPQAEEQLGSANFGKSVVNLSYTVPSNGFYKVALRAVTQDGRMDLNTDHFDIYLSTEDPKDVLNLDVYPRK